MKVSGDSPVILCRVNTPGSVSYSDEINFNDETGAISLVSPQTATVTYVGTTDSGIAFLRGKYFSTAGKFYYASPTANYYVDQYQPNAPYGIYAGEVVAEEVNVGEVNYVYSADRDAYPDSGEQDGYEYQYLGVPFENLPGASRIEVGSYIGNSKYGQSNPNTLTFGFEPIFFVVMKRSYSSSQMPNQSSYAQRVSGQFYAIRNAKLLGCTAQNPGNSGSTSPFIELSWEDKSVTWFAPNSSNPLDQFNESGTTYDYIVIG